MRVLLRRVAAHLRRRDCVAVLVADGGIRGGRGPPSGPPDVLSCPGREVIAVQFEEVTDEQVQTAGQEPEYFSWREAPKKARHILDWCRKGRHPLRRAFLVVDPSGDPAYPYELRYPDFADPQPRGHLWSGQELMRRHAKEMPLLMRQEGGSGNRGRLPFEPVRSHHPL
ncbi:MAG: hypothetical protein JWN14_3902 [Chthonomonadales bacterium]|nr:hypothetical protein [Chthonomonadales bacterium]